MHNLQQAARAYAASAGRRGIREQEAEVFRRVNAALRLGRDRGGRVRLRALIDNQRLWSAVIDLLRDADNALPMDLRADIVSVGLAVRREMTSQEPDFDFLITINENMAAGLSATH